MDAACQVTVSATETIAVMMVIDFERGLSLPLAQGSPWKYPWTPTWTASFWIPGLVGVFCIAVVAICYLIELRGISLARRALFTLLRSAAILLLTWMLLGWSWTPYAEEPADLILLIDSSHSMQTEDGTESGPAKKSVSREAAAKSILLSSQGAGLIGRVTGDYRPRVAHFGDETFWLSSDAVKQRREIEAINPNAQGTRLADAILDALRFQRGRKAAAMVILSDGVQTDGAALASVASAAKSADVPLFIIGLGDDRPPRDVRITQLIYSPSAFLGDVVNLEANLAAEGLGEVTLLVTLKNSKSDESLASERVTIHGGAESRVRLPIRTAEIGDWKFKIEVEKPSGDVNPENNTATGSIRVQEETVRVLLVDRRPRYDYRYLADVLSRARKRGEKAEPAFELKTFLQEGDIGLSRQDPSALDAFPTREELARCDVIILGDIDPRGLGAAAQRNLLEAITQGGAGLVLLPSAREAMLEWIDQPLELLLPARANEIAGASSFDAPRLASLSALGRQTSFCFLGEKVSQSESAWRTLPASLGILTTTHLRPDVRVLVEAGELRMSDGRPSPMVTTHFVGAAKVLFHWTDEWWRWAAPPTRAYYDQYWMQAIRALSSPKMPPGDEQFELKTDAARYLEGQTVRLTLHFRDENLAPGDERGVVVMARAGAISREIVLARDPSRRDLFHGAAVNVPPGAYVASVERPAVLNSPKTECRFEVTPRSNEAARLRPDFPALRVLAAQSGGKFYTAMTSDRLVDDLPRGSVVRTMPLVPRSAWNLPIWAALLVAILTSEWFLRRAGGLL